MSYRRLSAFAYLNQIRVDSIYLEWIGFLSQYMRLLLWGFFVDIFLEISFSNELLVPSVQRGRSVEIRRPIC